MPGGQKWTAWTQSAVSDEASVLEALARTDVPAPRPVATTNGLDTDGNAAILMTRAPGRLQVDPLDECAWVREMAVILARIHTTQIAAPEWASWIDPHAVSVPTWARRPDIWHVAIEAARAAEGGYRCFIHRDYQHFNILWRRIRITAVVDWVHASTGPPDIDVGHCRLNIAVLFPAELGEQFRRVYESEAGRKVDPQCDITALLSFNEGWHDGIPRQVGNRTTVDHAGMNARVEDLLAAAVARL
jgi:aminoglycoside phosphotransferase (APT) family kinase protein